MAKKKVAKNGTAKVVKGNHGKFRSATVYELAGRSCWICNNPDCQTITIASTTDDGLATKVGEAAHIHGEKPTAARWKQMDPPLVRHIDNGIWLCARCHTMIDKNAGKGFGVPKLLGWKAAHEARLRAILLSGGKILPYLRTHTEDGQLAQSLVNELANKGAMFQEMVFEAGPHVIASIEDLRDRIGGFKKQVKYDNILRKYIDDLHGHFRDYMNHTSKIRGWDQEKLIELRNNVAKFLIIVQAEYGCRVEGDLRAILPK